MTSYKDIFDVSLDAELFLLFYPHPKPKKPKKKKA